LWGWRVEGGGWRVEVKGEKERGGKKAIKAKIVS
jgi:hypothetical protein